ncbi:hypothetical protein HHL22_04545 [Hymenobacter sp. RP-2-7]|uniref:Uncharacterized protein n=1 Tax=Hymenobacter polaris TaxID=2682546 RepID=A0A7Y0FL56_9BACT|nr:hypothetical protein [Hymenobacter polaris]NML64467.1 hypothetical protein [Hymenobacter polaris]
MVAGLVALGMLAGGCGQPAPPAAAPVFSADSSVVRVAPSAAYARRGWWWRRLWGQHYRTLWAAPVAAPVLRLGAAGLTPERVGGSFQTNVLRLRAADGRWLVLRSVDKDLSRTLGNNWLDRLVAPVLRDQTCAAPPYGAYVAAELAHAAGVRHTNPRLVYWQPEAALGPLRPRFRAGLYLLEERPEGRQLPASSFGAASRVVGSGDMLGAVLTQPGARAAPRAYLRARLLDLLVGDWSRRADQWRWAAVADGRQTVFQPIPRDRDQAFFRFDDGWLTRVISWLRPRYQTFNPHLVAADVRALTVTARPLDHTLLALVPEAVFVAEADSLVRRLPDAVLGRALAAAPPEVRASFTAALLPALRARRDALPAVARRYYEVLQAEPVLLGTAAAERFELRALGPGRLQLRVWARRPPRPDSLLGEQAYAVRRTTRLSIYGLGGNDVFELRGRLAPGFGVHLYGGAGRNQFWQQPATQPTGPGLTVHATPADLLHLGPGVRVLSSSAETATPTWLARYYRLRQGK